MNIEDNILKIGMGFVLLLFIVGGISLFISDTHTNYPNNEVIEIDGMSELEQAGYNIESIFGNVSSSTQSNILSGSKESGVGSLLNLKNYINVYTGFFEGLFHSLGVPADSTLVKVIELGFGVFIVMTIVLLILRIFI